MSSFRLPSLAIAHRAGRTDFSLSFSVTKPYAVNDVPQPQLPVAFGFVKVKPDPMTPVT